MCPLRGLAGVVSASMPSSLRASYMLCDLTGSSVYDSVNAQHLLERVVLAEKYSRGDLMRNLWGLITKYHKEFPNLTVLAKLPLTSSVHTAACERGLSVQNRILTTFKNRLGIEKQQKVVKIKIDGARKMEQAAKKEETNLNLTTKQQILMWEKTGGSMNLKSSKEAPRF